MTVTTFGGGRALHPGLVDSSQTGYEQLARRRIARSLRADSIDGETPLSPATKGASLEQSRAIGVCVSGCARQHSTPLLVGAV